MLPVILPFFFHFFLFATLLPLCLCFADFGFTGKVGQISTSATIPRPHQLPSDLTLTHAHSYITALAPSASFLGNRSLAAIYSVGYHEIFGRDVEARGVFARGVFASDPPGTTCTPCGHTISATISSAVTALTCSTVFYSGVFRSSVVTSDAVSTATFCFATGYNGVFSTTTSTIPCCYSIPDSCFPSAHTSSTAYSGVFRGSTTTTFAPHLTTSSSNASPASTRTSSTVFPIMTTTTATSVSSIASVIVTSSTTLTVMLPSLSTTNPSTRLPDVATLGFPYISGCGTATGSGVISGSGTVLVGGFLPVRSSGVVTGSGTVLGCGYVSGTGTFTGSGVAVGCGTATGSGTIIGSGTVYIGPGNVIPVVSSGTVSGSAVVIGCGTIIGTGIFTATGIPSISPKTSSSIMQPPATASNDDDNNSSSSSSSSSSSNNLDNGLGFPNATQAVSAGTTVNVYVEDCTAPSGLPRLASNASSLTEITTTTTTTTVNTTSVAGNGSVAQDPQLCAVCYNDTAICCPADVSCNALGHCPWFAMANAGFVRFGLNIVNAANKTS